MEMILANNLVVVGLVALAAGLCLYGMREGLARAFEASVAGPFRAALASREHVATIRGVIENALFIGSGIAAVVGISGDSREAYLLGALLALVALLALIRLSRLAALLASEEAKAAHRKTAGTVRSIVRDELEAARRRAVPPRRLAKRECCCEKPPGRRTLKKARSSPRMTKGSTE